MTMTKIPANPGCKGRCRGFSLVELMVAMVVVGILLGAVYGVFLNFLSASGEQAALSKRSFDTRLGLQLMRSDLRQMGFGIAQEELGGAVSGSDTSLTLRSTAVHSQEDFAGTHGVLYEAGGNLTANNWLGGNIDNSQEGVIMTPSRDRLELVQLGNATAAPRNLFFAAPGTTTNGYYYQRTYYLGGGGTNAGCADGGVQNLLFADANPNFYSATSIVDCVRDLQIRYGYEMTSGGIDYVSDTSNTGSLSGSPVDTFPDTVKVGMIVQVGHEYRGQQPTPSTLSYSDGALASANPINMSTQQRRYRYQVVEWTLPLENMP